MQKKWDHYSYISKLSEKILPEFGRGCRLETQVGGFQNAKGSINPEKQSHLFCFAYHV